MVAMVTAMLDRAWSRVTSGAAGIGPTALPQGPAVADTVV
jgi:hypothetical protein